MAPSPIYTPVPWGYRFRYLDEQSGQLHPSGMASTIRRVQKLLASFPERLETALVGEGLVRKDLPRACPSKEL
jgi:hypothetical protein